MCNQFSLSFLWRSERSAHSQQSSSVGVSNEARSNRTSNNRVPQKWASRNPVRPWPVQWTKSRRRKRPTIWQDARLIKGEKINALLTYTPNHCWWTSIWYRIDEYWPKMLKISTAKYVLAKTTYAIEGTTPIILKATPNNSNLLNWRLNYSRVSHSIRGLLSR